MSHALMRSASRLFLVLICVTFLFVVTECSQPGGGVSNPSDVANVGTISPSALVKSGATTSLRSIADIKAAFNAINGSDPILSDIGGAFNTSRSITGSQGVALKSGPGNASGIIKFLGAFNGVVNRSLGGDITSQLSKLETDIQNFPTTKTLNETIDLSGNSLGAYVKLTTAKGTLSATAVTSDGGPLDTTTMANFQSANGQVTLSLVVDPQNLPAAGSAFKDFKLRINAGGTASVELPGNLVFDYGESAVLALSFANSSSAGGKIVLTANAKNKGTIALATLAQNYSSLAPSITVSLAAYDDNGNATFSQTWTDINSLVTAFSGP
jgi:hypothetical protein